MIRALARIAPVDDKCSPITDHDFTQHLSNVSKVARKRTGRLLLALIQSDLTLHEALAAAYIQGCTDSGISLIKNGDKVREVSNNLPHI